MDLPHHSDAGRVWQRDVETTRGRIPATPVCGDRFRWTRSFETLSPVECRRATISPTTGRATTCYRSLVALDLHTATQWHFQFVTTGLGLRLPCAPS